jgi:hypothetical protein
LNPGTAETCLVREIPAGFPATPPQPWLRQRPARHKRFGAFAGISGVGERKLAAYGEDILRVIPAHAREWVNDATG